MANAPSKRQDALRSIARAYDALREHGALAEEDVGALLPAWRALAPAGHPGAGADALDAQTLARIAALSPELVAARTLHVQSSTFRAPVRVDAADGGAVTLVGVEPGTALALALTLSLEGAKRAHGLGASADALRAAFPSPEAARSTLAALDDGGGARAVTFDAVTFDEVDSETGPRVAAALGDRPAYVFCAAGAFGVHDLLSPYARRLGAKLALAGRARTRTDDDAYRGIERIAALSPDSVEERLAAEEADGLIRCGRALVIQLDRLPESGVDGRARDAAGVLKKARAAIVCVPDDLALAAALSPLRGVVRAVAILTDATAACAPSVLVDAHGVYTPIDNALADGAAGPLVSLPSLHMRPDDGAVPHDARAFALAQVVLRAQYAAASPLASGARLAVRAVPLDDRGALSGAVLDVLARIGQKPPGPRGPTR